METKIYLVDELKNLFLQELINKTGGKVSKVSDHSVLNGIAFGSAKVFQKAMKDVALLEAELFPEYAYGEYLDKVAQRYGILDRQKDLKSSVFVKLVATPGSLYTKEQCLFTSTEGITFKLVNDFQVDANGYGYAELMSSSTGLNTNVPANSITKVTGAPSGHKYVINEVAAQGGLNEEDDQSFLKRILQNFNNFSFETLDKLTYIMQKTNPVVLSVKKAGLNTQGKVVLSVVTCNGSVLTDAELDILKQSILPYLSLNDLSVTNRLPGSTTPVVVQNASYTYIDLDFRISLYSNINPDEFRQKVQEQISQLLDFRNWTGTKVEWETLFAIVRTQSGVKAVPEQYFTPHNDTPVTDINLPRLRGFVMRDETGAVIGSNNGAITPVYYGPDYSKNVFNQINI